MNTRRVAAMKAKYKCDQKWTGTVGQTAFTVLGRTKREAVKRLRRMFAENGIPTIPDSMSDFLLVSGSGGHFLPAEGLRLSRRERQARR